MNIQMPYALSQRGIRAHEGAHEGAHELPAGRRIRFMATNVHVASPNALAAWAEKKLKPPPPSRTLRPWLTMKESCSGRMRPTACLIRLANWSQNKNVSKAAPSTIRPRFQPNFQINSAIIAAYIGAQTSLAEKNCQMGSVIKELQLLISRVNSWSMLCTSVQNIVKWSFHCHRQGRGPQELPPLQASPFGVIPRAYP